MSKITNYSSPFQSLYNKHHSYFLTFPPNSRWTKQSFREECDINTIMGRYLSTGELPDVSLKAPQYLDATGFDFQEMQNQVVEAKNLFMELPSKLRERFANDPAEFIDYCRDPENRGEMQKLGLLKDPAIAPESTNVESPISTPQPKPKNSTKSEETV